MKRLLSILTVLSVALTAICGPTRSMLGAQGCVRSPSSGLVPAEYRVVRAIKAETSSVSFQTGVFNTRHWEAEFSFYWPQPLSNDSKTFLGAPKDQKADPATSFALCSWGAGLYCSYGSWWMSVASPAVANDFNLCRLTVGEETVQCEINGILFTHANEGELTGNEIVIGGMPGRWGMAQGSAMGETIIVQDGVVAAHLFPVVRGVDETPCFFDVVQRVERLNTKDGAVSAVEF